MDAQGGGGAHGRRGSIVPKRWVYDEQTTGRAPGATQGTQAMPSFVGALDQGTTSTRFMIFDHAGRPVGVHQLEHTQIYPKAGWVEHDPIEILGRVHEVIRGALERANLTAADLVAVGITNQRETTVAWDRTTGKPLANAIVWQDTRTDGIVADLAAAGGAADGGPDRFRAATGLPLATYFAGPKIRWLIDNVPAVRDALTGGRLLVGTIDSWCIWNLTGGVNGGVHITDVTNAGRTMLMDLHTLNWSPALLEAIGVPRSVLPEIRSSSEIYGIGTGPIAGVPIAGDLGDQHAALFGQACFEAGDAKNTYGTGCFMVLNTGERIVESRNGLLTTLAYKLGDAPAVYALEGSVAIAGALIQWLRDNLGLITSASEVETLARTVDDSGGIVIVPAFSGLFAPYWRSDARGAIVGLTRYVNRGHIARAALEATAWPTREVLDAMNADSGVPLASLRVDGGMVGNELLMQFQADVLGVRVIRPTVAETTALGAAYAAGLAVGFWTGLDELRANWSAEREWLPAMDPAARDHQYARWKKAVTRTFDWVD